VAVGFVEVVVMSTLADAVMHGTGVFPPFGEPMGGGLFLLALALLVLAAPSVLAGAALARRA
jgi:hypothetical protein